MNTLNTNKLYLVLRQFGGIKRFDKLLKLGETC